MPGMSGSVLIRKMRGMRRAIPIVLRARAAGANEILKKPLSARDLGASLARVLQQ
jgi:FixJ family two-component response regulator